MTEQNKSVPVSFTPQLEFFWFFSPGSGEARIYQTPARFGRRIHSSARNFSYS